MDFDPETFKYIIAPSGMLFTWALAHAHHRTLRHRQDAQKEIQLALLNRFSSGEEMTRFLATEEGRRLVDQLSASPDAKDPMEISAGMAIGGCITTALSGAFFILSRMDNLHGFIVPAVMCSAVALGLFAAALISRKLAKANVLLKRAR